MSRLTLPLIEHAPQFVNVLNDREIDLRGHNICIVENLGAARDAFDTIDLSDNQIYRIEHFPLLRRLKSLLVANNRINHISDAISTQLPNLETFILTNNRIERLEQLSALQKLPELRYLSLDENPIQHIPNYRLNVLSLLPQLRYLDFRRITARERDAARRIAESRTLPPGAASAASDAAGPAGAIVAPPPLIGTFIPGEAGDTQGLTLREKEVLRAAIDNATTLAEVRRLEQCLVQGILPNDLREKL